MLDNMVMRPAVCAAEAPVCVTELPGRSERPLGRRVVNDKAERKCAICVWEKTTNDTTPTKGKAWRAINKRAAFRSSP